MPKYVQNPSRGFTLVELLVVISIIAILSVAGIAVFTGVQKGVRDSRRKADIDAIAKAYESKSSAGSYVAIADSDFASSSKPKDPNASKGDYFNWLSSDGSGFKACASLDNNPSNICNTPALNCYCKFSSQSTLNPSSPVNTGASTSYTVGLGGSSQSSCDTNGTLLSGLVGYWKMDESFWNGTAGEVMDSSGNGSHATAYSGATTAVGRFGNSGSFDGAGDYVDIPDFALGGDSSIPNFTLAAWIYLNSKTRHVIFGTNQNDDGLHIIGSTMYLEAGPNRVSWSNTTPSSGLWHHIAATVFDNSGTAELFINGLSQGQRSLSGFDQYWGTGNEVFFYLGRDYCGSSDCWLSGKLDDVRIYNRALSSLEISDLYNSGNGCVP